MYYVLTNDDYPDLFDGLEADTLHVEVDARGYFNRGKITGPPEDCYPDEGGFEILDTTIDPRRDGEEVDLEVDADAVLDALGRGRIEEDYFDQEPDGPDPDVAPEPEPIDPRRLDYWR